MSAKTRSYAEDRIRELKTAIQVKAAAIESAGASWKDETGKGQFVLTNAQETEYKNLIHEAQTIREEIATYQKALGVFDFIDAPSGSTTAQGDARDHLAAQREVKSLGSAWLDSDAYREMKESGFRRVGDPFTVNSNINALWHAARVNEVKDVYSAMGGTIEIPTIGSAQSLGWTERTLRPGRVRDLFPAERTTASILYGIRETGFTSRAAVVPERTAANGGPATGGPTDVFGLKPRSEIEITPYSAPIATIAHIMYVHRQTLDDEPRMRGMLDRDMVDGVKMEEDNQLLNGDGIGDHLTGLTLTDGVQTYTGLATDKRTAQIRRAMTRAILAYYPPTGLVLNPLDWESVELEVDGNGAYTVATSVAVGGEKRIWRLNVVDSLAMTQGKFLLGSFGTGAKVFDREAVTVALSTENRDMFERNAYTLRAEERVGLVVDRPESFVKGTFTTPA